MTLLLPACSPTARCSQRLFSHCLLGIRLYHTWLLSNVLLSINVCWSIFGLGIPRKWQNWKDTTCIKFCLKLGKNAPEAFKMLIVAFGKQLMLRTQVSVRFSKFKSILWPLLQMTTLRMSTDAENRWKCGSSEESSPQKQNNQYLWSC